MKKKKSKFPVFKSIKEEAKFWDTHSFTDYWDEMKEVDMVVELDSPRTESLIVRVQKEMKDKMSKVARSKGLNISTLARMWMMEKLKTV
jgi:hypothetical protein